MLTLTKFPRLHERHDPASLQFKAEAYQIVLRRYSAHLSAYELIVLTQIVDRTAGWGKLEASFTTKALREGDDYYGGIANAVGRTAMFEALASLEAKGILNRRPDVRNRDKRHYSVNFDWRPNMSIPTSDRLQNRVDTPSATRTTPSVMRTDASATRTLYTGNHRQVIKTGNHCDPASRAAVVNSGPEEGREVNPAARVRARAGEAAAVSTVARQTKVAKASITDAVGAAETVWRNAIREAFPGVPATAWGARERGQAKNAIRLWHKSGVTFNDLLDWAARNWAAIMRKQFKWMNRQSPPDVPTISFVHAFLDQFKECHASGKLEQWLDKADRTEIEKIMARGVTYEEAMHELAQRKAASGLREEMEKREAEVRLQNKVARIRLDKAERLEKLGGIEAPPHPRSKLAQRLRAEARAAAAPQPTTLSGPDPDFPEVMVPFVDPDRNPFDYDE